MNLFPLATFDHCDHDVADALLVAWGHWLGACNRPFGRHSFALSIAGLGPISVAVSASTVNARCGGFDRGEVVELARLCSAPDHRWATRVALRLWRELAPVEWSRRFWPVRAVVSYANTARHTGDIYRFDGWRKVADVPGGTSGGGWARTKAYEAKTVWAFELPRPALATELAASAAAQRKDASP